MRADPGTRPEKAASGVEGDPVPASGTKANEWTGISRDCLRKAPSLQARFIPQSHIADALVGGRVMLCWS
ncbi:hypothetical protein VULLAG_LOCUS10564 [Vulpes lagopus]